MAALAQESRHADRVAPRERRGEIPAQERRRGEAPVLQPLGLQAAIYETVHGRRGLAKDIAAVLQVPVSGIHDIADPQRRVPLKAAQIPAMVRASGSFAILNWLAAEVNCVVVPLPPVNPHQPEFYAQAGRLATRVGEALQTLPEILRDGRIDAAENKLFATMGRELMADMAALMELVEAKAKQDEKPR